MNVVGSGIHTQAKSGTHSYYKHVRVFLTSRFCFTTFAPANAILSYRELRYSLIFHHTIDFHLAINSQLEQLCNSTKLCKYHRSICRGPTTPQKTNHSTADCATAISNALQNSCSTTAILQDTHGVRSATKSSRTTTSAMSTSGLHTIIMCASGAA